MNASNQQRLTVAREILISLITGAGATLLLTAFRAAGLFPHVTDTLLRPGSLLARKLRADSFISALATGIVIGSLPFFIMHIRSWRRRKHSLSLQTERRRARRVLLTNRVFVYGHLNEEPFSEATETLNVSSTGGLLSLSVKMEPLQNLILTNAQTEEDSFCRVARSEITEDGKILTAIEFIKPSSNFWQKESVSDSADSSIASHSEVLTARHAR